MVFCAYCGKCFTRKEHLERHIPTHTNVKPHRCTACQLSFSRRDLLQRHYSTYHEAKDATSPLPGQVAMIAGRAPIACANCANAKTGCDKRVPCARCADKNLPCAARFARRSSKMVRKITMPSETTPTHIPTSNPMELDVSTSPDPSRLYPSPQENNLDPRLQNSPKSHHGFTPTMPHSQIIPSPPNGLDAVEELMQMNADMTSPAASFQDVLAWNSFTFDMDMYPNPEPLPPPELNILPLSEKDEATSGSCSRHSSSRGSVSTTHTRSTSIASLSDFQQQTLPSKINDVAIPESDVVITADSAWPLARCNPPIFSGACPRTALIHLESLEKNSKHDSIWISLDQCLRNNLVNTEDILSVKPLTASTRDTLLVITQSFLHKALDVHCKGAHRLSGMRGASMAGFNFLVLPPSSVLEYFLMSYHRSLSSYYILSNGRSLDPNELMENNNQVSALLVLLMISHGAESVPTSAARSLTAGLLETCRISLFDAIEKDVELSADPTILCCALLFILLAAWSGDKWHMDIAMGQRGMYLAMIKHAGLLEAQPSSMSSINPAMSLENQWKAWINAESRHRLVYNWVLVDQELSLFYDRASVLSIAEVETPVPSAERLWKAADASEWMHMLQESYSQTGSPGTPLAAQLNLSLRDLFYEFAHDDFSTSHAALSPHQLRLLLHPLQSLLHHLRQVMSCFSDENGVRRGSQPASPSVSPSRQEEAQSLLQKWYDMCMLHANNDPHCAVTRVNLALYHLISLNAVASVAEIERLARKDGFDGNYWEPSRRYKQCIQQPQEALFHAGQVLRHVRSMPKESRPQWWSLALYRVTLVFWATSMSGLDPNFPKSEPTGAPFTIDSLPADHPAVVNYLWQGQGVPMLSRTDGGYTSLEMPQDVLCHCVDLLNEGTPTRLSDGLKRKLQTLFERWNLEPLHTPT